MPRSPVTYGQSSVFGIVGYDDPLVVVGGQRDLGHAFGRNILLPGSQNVKFRAVRFVV